MSQSVVSNTVENAGNAGRVSAPGSADAQPRDESQAGRVSVSSNIDPNFEEAGDFNYRPVPILVPVVFALGVLSSIGLMILFGLIFGLLGTVLGVVCIRKIRRSEGALGGGLLAWIGCLLSFVFLSSGSVLQAYTFATEVPEGYQRVNFYFDISKKGFAVNKGHSDYHPDVKNLDKQKIFLKGFMYPVNQTEGLVSFVLVKDSGTCCFGGQPAATDMMLVNMQGGKTVNYKTGMVAVAGTFHCLPVQGLTGLNENPVYSLDADMMESARTSF